MFLKANKIFPVIIVLATAIFLMLIDITISSKKVETNNVKINEIVQMVEAEIKKGDLSGLTYDGEYNFIVVNNSGQVLYGLDPENISLYERKNNAIKNNQLILNFSEGYIFIDTNVNLKFVETLKTIKTAVYIFLLIFMFFAILYYYYFYFNLIKPFKKLQSFAARVAMGNLDSPLYRTKANYFGLFTDSFDIMREELKKAKEKAASLEKSKKELVAQLSHDIKTPIASIKAVIEIMQVAARNAKDKNHLELISLKANDIDRLVSDLFASTLEELSELKVNCADIESGILLEIIKKSDISQKVKFKNSVPECLIKSDALRLGQVFDNIINNSYKYAGTNIEVSFDLNEKLVVTVKDFGKGIDEEEIPLITNKFFRGKNSKDISGAGLGLNIASNFMKKMGGGLELQNVSDGFEVIVIISLS